MKDTLHAYDQLMALDLNESFPGVQKTPGVRTPALGEVRLIHSVMTGG